jgi:hypothetical protein
MTYRDKSVSRLSKRSGFYPGKIASIDGQDVEATVPHLAGDVKIAILEHVGSIPGIGEDIFVSFLNGLDDELAVIFPSSGGKIEYDFFIAASNARNEIKNRADYVCDGVNDEIEIQAAIDAIVSGDYGNDNPSGRIVLSGGDFYLNAPISAPYDVIETLLIVGAGKEITRVTATFQPQNGEVAVFNANKTKYLTIVGLTLTFQASETLTADFYVVSTNYLWWSYVRLEDVKIESFGVGDASDVFANGIYAYVVHVERSDISVDGYGFRNVAAFWCDLSKASANLGDIVESSTPWFGNQSLFVFNSEFYATDGAGLNMNDSSRSIVFGNVFHTSGPALKFGNAFYGTFIDGNVFNGLASSTPFGLIEVEYAYQLFVTNNVFANSSGSAVKLVDSLQYDSSFYQVVKISGNSFAGSAESDIDFSSPASIHYESGYMDISANTFRASGGYAVDASTCRYLTIVDNSIFSSLPHAVRISGADIFTIWNNVVAVTDGV